MIQAKLPPMRHVTEEAYKEMERRFYLYKELLGALEYLAYEDKKSDHYTDRLKHAKSIIKKAKGA